jgi:osmotically-inducible protein OsmY
VQSEQEQAKAIEIARGTSGVADMVNRLSVAPAAELTTGRYGETPGTADRTDPGVTAEVKTRLLADPSVSGLKIDVDTRDCVVTLAGMASTQAEKARALEIARGVENVASVEDKLTVGR